jgi:hypothetical protein
MIAGGSTCPFPRCSVETLIDDGSHLVLISNSLVNELQLNRQKLYKPLPVNTALENHAEPNDFFYEWTYIKLYDPNNNWAARKVHAVIAPSLCTEILLGLPFLTCNNLVTDYSDRTCIDKITGFDLMNPKPPPWAPEPKPSLKEKYHKIMTDRKCLLTELANICSIRKRTVDEISENVKEYNVAGAVRTQIEQLSFKDQLSRLNDAIKDKFKDVFSPIPHVNELPTDIYYRINLKDTSKTIATRSYACPRKYKDTWQTLIQQHLDAGQIRLSSSAHASLVYARRLVEVKLRCSPRGFCKVTNYSSDVYRTRKGQTMISPKRL